MGITSNNIFCVFLIYFFIFYSKNIYSIPVPELANLGVSGGGPFVILFFSFLMGLFYKIKQTFSYRNFCLMGLLLFFLLFGLHQLNRSYSDFYKSRLYFKYFNLIHWGLDFYKMLESYTDPLYSEFRILPSDVHKLMEEDGDSIQLMGIQTPEQVFVYLSPNKSKVYIDATKRIFRKTPIKGSFYVTVHDLLENPDAYFSATKTNIIYCFG